MKNIGVKVLCVMASILFLFSLVGCEKDLKKEKYSEEVDIPVATEPTSIQALEKEITDIAYTYDDGGVLTEAIAIFRGDTEIGSELGEIHFTFCRDDKESGRGTIVIVTYSMVDKKVIKVSYEQGDGRFTETSQEPIQKDAKGILFNSIFEMLRNDNNMSKKLAGENIKLTIEFTSEGFKPALI